MISPLHSKTIYLKSIHTLYDVFLLVKQKYYLYLFLCLRRFLFFSLLFSKLEHLTFKIFHLHHHGHHHLAPSLKVYQPILHNTYDKG